MVRRQLRQLNVFAALLAGAVFAVAAGARAEGGTPAVDGKAPPYTLAVDSDATDILSYEAIAARLAADLGRAVARPAGASPALASIVVRYRGATRSLSVRADHGNGRVLERSVRADGDAVAVQREAILLAGNLARDEAKELIDELAARRAPAAETAPAATPLAKPPEVRPPDDEQRSFATFAVVYPLATNARRPDIRTSVATSILYGHVGYVDGLALGSGVTHASRGTRGAAVAMLATISGGEARGYQGSVGANVALGGFSGLQMAGGLNLAGKDASGVQVAAGANVALAHMDGVQASGINVGGDVTGLQLGVVNIARHVKGAQVGVINFAEDVDGAAIGVVSIARDMIHPVVWASNLAYTNVGIKFATKYAYTVVAVGFGTNEAKLKLDDPVFNAALGAHLPIAGPLDVDLEVVYSDLDLETASDANRALHTRVLPGWSFAKHLRIFAGGGVRIPLSFDRGSRAVRPEAVVGMQF